MAAAPKHKQVRHGVAAPAFIVLAGLATVIIAGIALAGGRGDRPVDFTTTAVGAESARPVRVLAGTDIVTGKHLIFRSPGGKAVVVSVWTSNCAPCTREEAVITRFAQVHPAVAMVAIDTGETAMAARTQSRPLGWRFPVIVDPDAKLATKLGVNGLPTTLFLDRDRRIVMRVVGAADESALERGLRLANLS